MKKKRSVLVGLMAVSALGTGFAGAGKEYRIDMRVFEIPPWQSLVTNKAAGEKGIIGLSKVGDVTASFPEGIVLIRTELDKDEAESKIKEELLSRGYFKETKSAFPSGVGWWTLGVYSFSCPQDEFGVETSRKEYHYGPASSPGMNRSEYWLTIRPKSADEKDAVLGLKFECRLKTEKFPEGANAVLLDQEVEIPLGKMLLIGFSSKDLALRKTVYFIAAYIQKTES
jgi:hypothetical protein